MKQVLEMNRRFLRSVNLGRDRKAKNGLAGYVITPSVRRALGRLLSAFTEDITERAFTLTGPYGTGKSSFGLFFWHLLSNRKDEAWKMLQIVDEDLAKKLKTAVWGKKSDKGCLVLTLTARCAAVAELLADAFDSADIDYSPEIQTSIQALRASRDTKKSLALVQTCVKTLCANGYNGVFFVFDEFGKVFEEARRDTKDSDIFLLQELAEAASRSEKARMYFLGMMHQSFADYAGVHTDLRDEFRKIEGRFEPISFSEPTAAQIHLAATSFPSDNPCAANQANVKLVTDIVATLKLGSLVGLADSELKTYAKGALPLHPMTLAALPLLFRRFGQNERSIFSFLTGNEALAFQSFMREATDGSLYRLSDLFDYFFENFEAELARHAFGQPFVEAHAAIQSKASLSAVEVEVLKTVAVLTSLGLQSPIRASEKMVAAAIAPVALGSELENLRKQSVLVYRKFNHTYALWNGSDIDLQECCENADREIQKGHSSIAEALRKFLPPTPIVAKRHTAETGSLRYFDVVYIDDKCQLQQFKTRHDGAAAGSVVVCLSTGRAQQKQFVEEAARITGENNSLVVAVPSDISELTEALQEIRRLNWVEANVPELRDDRIARREVAVRLAAATQSVIQYQFCIMDPRPSCNGGGGCRYFRNGEEQNATTPRAVTSLLSDVCDELYPLSPIIKNELVNKRAPSAQAAAARRILINALNNPELVAKPRFGIEGYPPERSIYESVVALSGLHEENSNGWELKSPDSKSQTRLDKVWKRIEELVFTDRKAPLIVKDLFTELAKPPYGVLEGLAPIILAAFYAVNKDEVSLYSEGTFIPDPQEAHFELLIRRPELFSISGMHIKGMRQQIVTRLARGLDAEDKVLAVVRRLYSLMNSLPKYSKETNSVSESTKKFRQAFFDARSPEKLMFVSLPEAFGLEPISDANGDERIFDSYFTQLNNGIHELGKALPKLVDENRKYLLKCCGFEETALGWKRLYDRASYLLARIGGSDICPFLQNVVNTAGDWDKADQVMSYIQQTPISKWGASHIAEFKKNAIGIGERFAAAARPYRCVVTGLSDAEKNSVKEVKTRICSNTSGVDKRILVSALQEYLEQLLNEAE